MQLESARISSPVGILEITGSLQGIRSILFIDENSEPTTIPDILQECTNQLSEYFAGTRRKFDLLLDPVGTDFQLRVWQQLVTIPFGNTISYLELARLTGSEFNTRAVGNANGKNKINIVVPCHRVVAASGECSRRTSA